MKQIKLQTQAFIVGVFVGAFKLNPVSGYGAYCGFLAVSDDPELSAKGYANLERMAPSINWRETFAKQRELFENASTEAR